MKILSYRNRRYVTTVCGLNRITRGINVGLGFRSVGWRLFRSFRLGDDGQSLVEFGVLLPIVMIVLTGVLSVGQAFGNRETLVQAVGTGAQTLQTLRGTTTDPCQDTYNAIALASPGLDVSKITLSYNFNGTAPTLTGQSCSGQEGLLQSGTTVTVTGSYPCNILMAGYNFSPSCSLVAQLSEYEY